MEITLEKIELVKDRTGVSYKEAKEALEAADGSVVDAIIAIEETVDVKKQSKAGEVANETVDKIKELVKKGNVSKISVKKDEETIVNQPLNPVSSGGAGSSASVTPQPKKSSKALWVTLLLACLALLGSAAAYLHANRFTELFTKVDDPNPDDANLPQADTLTT